MSYNLCICLIHACIVLGHVFYPIIINVSILVVLFYRVGLQINREDLEEERSIGFLLLTARISQNLRSPNMQ